jgi:hypothetical protein
MTFILFVGTDKNLIRTFILFMGLVTLWSLPDIYTGLPTPPEQAFTCTPKECRGLDLPPPDEVVSTELLCIVTGVAILTIIIELVNSYRDRALYIDQLY